MDKISCGYSTADSCVTTAGSSGGKDNPSSYLRQLGLNKLSHRIAKPPPGYLDPGPNPNLNPNPVDQHHPTNLQQPPVYNINKNDFREVVQKLTGAPAHERLSSPPPIQTPRPPSSRLQRIRPPPLEQLSARPPPLLNHSVLPQDQTNPVPPPTTYADSGVPSGFNPLVRPAAPLSPLPPLPGVHAAAESPVSAYMRYLKSSAAAGDSRPYLFSGFTSPLAPPATLPPPPPAMASTSRPPPTASQPAFQLPASPLPFGCLNSPRSPYTLLSPGLLFSPSSSVHLGFPQIPLSPSSTVPVLSPRYR